MSGRVGLLGALLGLQLLVIAAVLFMESDAGADGGGTLLSFAPPAVEELRVSAPELQAPLVIRSSDAGWVLPNGLPADGARVEELLDRLSGLRAQWPVATSSGARARFEVAEDNHQRHLELIVDGDTVADLYLGTSPGYQRVHARRAGDDEVFSVELSNYQVPTDVDEWLDKTLLRPRGDISAVSRDGTWHLRRDAAGDWQLDDVAADPEAAENLVRRIRELRVTGSAAAPAEGATPSAEFFISDAEGEYAVVIFGEDDGNAYTVASSRRDGEYFGLGSYAADQILLDRAALLPESEAAPAAAADTTE